MFLTKSRQLSDVGSAPSPTRGSRATRALTATGLALVLVACGSSSDGTGTGGASAWGGAGGGGGSVNPGGGSSASPGGGGSANPGSGGSVNPGGGGSVNPGSGGSVNPGSGGSVNPGIGGSVNPGSGGSVNPGSGGGGGAVNPGTGGSVNPGTGGSVNPGTGGSVNPGTGGSAGTGGTTVSGGAAGTGGGANGGSPGTAADLSCTDPVYGAVSIPGIQVISDFETTSLLQYVQDGRGQDALPWYAYASGDTNDSTTNIMQTPGPINPLNSANTFAVDSAVHGPCSTKGALHITSPGPANSSDYVGFGIDFMARPGTAKKKLAYDGSKYTGVGFWGKCSKDLQFAFSKVVDAAQDADIDPSIVPSPCSYSSGTICNQYGIKNTVITKDWTYHKLYFSELLQDPNGSTFTSGVDPTKLIAFQIHVNPFSPRSGSASANPIDCYIDDVHFLTEPAPKPPSETVTWSVSGTKIQRNGADYKIRGIVRPSMEWDCAGFGITREDAQRIKAWHANAVRLAVKDTLWAGASTGGATCNGGAYQNQVKRAVNWLLEQKMDVILDLHYVGGTPSSENANFWNSISKDAFFKDGRIIYELYNEPTGDVNSLRTWHNSTIATIRGNGANNLILVSGPDYTYDLSGYVTTPVTDSANKVAYAVHPYIFKPEPDAWKTACGQLPVVATEFGDANVQEIGHSIAADQCDASIYSKYMSDFESMGMSWTAWAWIVDEWGCGFPQMIADYSGTPNVIGTPVKQQLTTLNP